MFLEDIIFLLFLLDQSILVGYFKMVLCFVGEVMVSKGVISLRNDRGTSYGKYIAVQNEIAAAVNELRNSICMETFGKKYNDLDPLNEIEKDVIAAAKKVYPMAISEAEPKEIK